VQLAIEIPKIKRNLIGTAANASGLGEEAAMELLLFPFAF
jgi:hypothetical protein